MVKITDVEQGSPARLAGIVRGDALKLINGNEINDVIDYRFYLTESRVTLTLVGERGEYTVTVEKGEYDDVGLVFETPLMDKKHSCKNGCIFCFIDQNPDGLRDSLYFKDDDSRLSFIHGNYVTLTNMTDEDVARIIKMRISPINVSIHTTNPELRVKMMKNRRSGEVLRYLDDFKNAGLKMHGQIVLCRGVNDGNELVRTLTDLAEYYPALESVAIVPAGLTKHREGLYPLSDFSRKEARRVIRTVDRVARAQYRRYGTRQFYVADELYQKAGLRLPSMEYYEDFSQIENGVGMLCMFLEEFARAADSIRRGRHRASPRTVTVATGAASYDMINSVSNAITRLCPEIRVNVKKIINNFYGESVTVSGLLTGKDIYGQLKDEPLGDILLIPSSCVRADECDFLCGMTLAQLGEQLNVEIHTVDNDGFAFAEAVLGISLDP